MRLYITRHGETEWNREKRYQGQRDSPLTSAGEVQARLLARRIAQMPFAVVIASDSRRAWRTAELAVAGRGLAVQRDMAWRERSYGTFEGLTRDEVIKRFPDEWKQRQADPVSWRPPGGESLLDLQRRIVGALDSVARRYLGQEIFVVTHSAALWTLLCTLVGDDLATAVPVFLNNCGLSCVHWDGLSYHVEWLNDVTHLQEA